MSLRWSAKHWPIIERAKRGLLPERLSIAEIAQLHPLGDDFAKTLLEECTIYMHRQGNGLPIDDVEAGFSPPPPEAGEGLRFDDVDTETLLRRMLDHPNRYEIDPLACNPYNGHFYLIHRDDLRIYLQKEGEWPLPEDAPLRLWWPDEITQHTGIVTGQRPPKPKVIEGQIKRILDAIATTGWPVDAIPYRGRATIERALIDAGALTKHQFKRAWQEANDRGLIRVTHKERYAGRPGPRQSGLKMWAEK